MTDKFTRTSNWNLSPKRNIPTWRTFAGKKECIFKRVSHVRKATQEWNCSWKISPEIKCPADTMEHNIKHGILWWRWIESEQLSKQELESTQYSPTRKQQRTENQEWNTSNSQKGEHTKTSAIVKQKEWKGHPRYFWYLFIHPAKEYI